MRTLLGPSTSQGGALAGKHDPKRDPGADPAAAFLRTGPIVVRGIARGLRDTVRAEPNRRHAASEPREGTDESTLDPQPVPLEADAVEVGPGELDRASPRRPGVSRGADDRDDAGALPRVRAGVRELGDRMRDSGSRLIAVLVVAALVGAAALLVVAVGAQSRTDASEAARRADSFSPPPLPSVVPIRGTMTLIGDEAALQPASAVGRKQRWAGMVADRTGLALTDLAIDGAGFLASGARGRTFLTVAQGVPADSDVVVIVGGGHDAGRTQGAITRAVAQTIAAVRQRAPDARIVVVGPLTAGEDPIAVQDVRRAVREGAAVGKATWVDPISGDWLAAGTAPNADGVYSSADSARIASRLAPVLDEALR